MIPISPLSRGATTTESPFFLGTFFELAGSRLTSCAILQHAFYPSVSLVCCSTVIQVSLFGCEKWRQELLAMCNVIDECVYVRRMGKE